jgi:predicted PurR-regulated permease PerM
MTDFAMQSPKISKLILLSLVFLISAIFLFMIRPFLMALLLAGIFSAMGQPIHVRITRALGERPRAASLLVLVLFCLVFLLPLSGLVGVITAQALKVAASIRPWVQQFIDQPAAFSAYLQNIPYYEEILPYRDEIIAKAGEWASSATLFLVDFLSQRAIGTINFILMFFIFLYTSYFFLIDGRKLLNRMLYYLPLDDTKERRLMERFTSVTRATLKGTAVIGVLQGGLAGVAFAVVGIDAAVFWGTVMSILSIIPGLGSALIWLPAAIILAIGGSYGKAVGLTLFCGLVVGSLDNLLRPRLVGKDTKMHDLMIFLGTLGGIAFFGLIGFIIGPIVAALFVTVWEIYGESFRDILPESGFSPPSADPVKEEDGPPSDYKPS